MRELVLAQVGLVILDMWELCYCNFACGLFLSYVGQSGSGRCVGCGSWRFILLLTR